VKIDTSMKTGLRSAFAMMVLAGALVLPSQAAAQSECSQANSDPTAAQYCSPAGVQEHGGNNNGEVKGVNEGSTEPTAEPVAEVAPTVEAVAVQESSTGSSLPFTGLDVGVLVVVALALGGAGLVLRRLTTPREGRS
jgi:hypothetical protein